MEQREPTHILTISVPVFMGDLAEMPEFDVFADVTNLALGLSRVAYRDYICGQAYVEVHRAGDDS